MHLGELCDRLDTLLDIDAYAGIDASANGLQIGHRDTEVTHVACAVDAAVESCQRAGAVGAEVLLVHHGLVWGGITHLNGIDFDRFHALVTNDLNLYAAHLPLDGHQEVGNAAIIADRLNLRSVEAFAQMEGHPIGVIGELERASDQSALVDALAEAIEMPASSIDTLGDVHPAVSRVAIVTGSGTDFIEPAADAGADVLITGEGKHSAYHRAQEAGIDVLFGGHYATETLGVQALADRIETWGLETTFIDIPTGF